MARDDIGRLYRLLMQSAFAFVPRGERRIEEIYVHVRKRYPKLCDDRYLCAENCTGGHDQAEWKHTVRRALSRARHNSIAVGMGSERGLWRFR